MMYEAVATLDNGRSLSFELQDYQVHDFVAAVSNKMVYTDDKTGVISWLPPERLHHLIVKPNLESPKCPESPQSDQVSDLLT